MVKVGKDFLKQALRDQEYQDYIEAKRAEIEHWQTLSEDQKREQLMAENFPADAHITIEARA